MVSIIRHNGFVGGRVQLNVPRLFSPRLVMTGKCSVIVTCDLTDPHLLVFSVNCPFQGLICFKLEFERQQSTIYILPFICVILFMFFNVEGLESVIKYLDEIKIIAIRQNTYLLHKIISYYYLNIL